MIRAAAAMVLVLSAAACFPTPGAHVVDGWIFPSAAPVPPGMRPVALAVQAQPKNVEPNAGFACNAALSRATIRYDPTGDPPVRYDLAAPASGDARWIWPWGFSARDNAGRLEIVAPNGTVFAHDGEALDVGGGLSPTGDGFQLCIIDWMPRRQMPL